MNFRILAFVACLFLLITWLAVGEAAPAAVTDRQAEETWTCVGYSPALMQPADKSAVRLALENRHPSPQIPFRADEWRIDENLELDGRLAAGDPAAGYF